MSLHAAICVAPSQLPHKPVVGAASDAYEHETAQGFGLASQLSVHVGAEIPGGSTGFFSLLQHNTLLDWGGGALSVGLYVDVPVNDRDAFIRAGMRGGAEYRILLSLYKVLHPIGDEPEASPQREQAHQGQTGLGFVW